MLVKDERGRELEVVTQWQPSYSRLRKDMRCDTIISSLSRDFDSVLMIADLWAPACDVWIGDYPYLQQLPFKRVLKDINSRLSAEDIPSVDEGLESGAGADADADADAGGDVDESKAGDGILSQWISRARGNELSPDFEAGEWDDDADFYPSDARASSRFVKNVASRRGRSRRSSGGGGGNRGRGSLSSF